MERNPITCFIVQIDIQTSENNAALCTARFQIANETALPDKSLNLLLLKAFIGGDGESRKETLSSECAGSPYLSSGSPFSELHLREHTLPKPLLGCNLLPLNFVEGGRKEELRVE